MELNLYTKEEVEQRIANELKPLQEKIQRLEKSSSTSLTGLASTKKICEELDIDRTTLISWRDRYNLPAYNPTGKNIFWDIQTVITFIKTGQVI